MAPSSISEFIDPADSSLDEQWKSVLARKVVPAGTRQVRFVPCEVVLSLCASLLVDHHKYGSTSAHRAEYPVQHLARLFKRPPSSFLAKMANLDGSRSHGGRHEMEVSTHLLSDSTMMQDVYLRILRAARRNGIDREQLPDFLDLEDGGALWLVGQEELSESEIEKSLESILEKRAREQDDVPVELTQRLLTATVRIGQHRFAQGVLANHQHRCVFCGLSGIIAGERRRRMLTASHIKPWRDSTGKERLDNRNGFTACPTHDVAFDTGLITVDSDLNVKYSPGIESDMTIEAPLRAALGKPPLADKLLLPDVAVRPDVVYLDWHRTQIFVAS
ncbi:HNH endonuclease [Rhodococcus sp. NPDC057014]|uniref:HNH endonuclease n=1 Tax=Rhodococcus sp. NPDC057014 TaxID=3346000 RepID=UPI00363D90FB